jgi:hypothetical protein
MHLGWGIGFLRGLVANAMGQGPRQRGDPPAPVEGPADVGTGGRSATVTGTTATDRHDDTTTRRIA